MRPTEITLRGYKRTAAVVLEDFGKYNALIGPNNSGKSSVAQALFYPAFHQRSMSEDPPFYPVGTSFEDYAKTHIREPWDVAMVFPKSVVDADGTVSAGFTGRVQGSAKSAAAKLRVDASTSDMSTKAREQAAWEAFLRNVRFYGPFEDLTRHQGFTIERPDINRRASNLSAVLWWHRTNDTDQFRRISAAFLAVFPEYHSLFTPTVAAGVSVSLRPTADTELPLGSLGDGIARVLGWLTCVVTSPPGGLVILDEPEVGLHPRLQRRLKRQLRLIADDAEQTLLVLTHSPTWADSDDGSVYRIADDGSLVSLSSVRDAAMGLGGRPSDAGFDDVVLHCEGESEEAALPVLFASGGRTVTSLGLHVRNLHGAGIRRNEIAADIAATASRGQIAFVALDWADWDGKSRAEVLAAVGAEESALTLWTKDTGAPGEFEDVFGVDVLYDAFCRVTGSEGKPPPEDVFRNRINAASKTSHGIRQLYNVVTKASLSKPRFCLAAAEVWRERGEAPPQVRSLLEAIVAAVEE